MAEFSSLADTAATNVSTLEAGTEVRLHTPDDHVSSVILTDLGGRT